ncbi:hypothetical protein J2X04_003218, partial [Lysobacter niabensis]
MSTRPQIRALIGFTLGAMGRSTPSRFGTMGRVSQFATSALLAAAVFGAGCSRTTSEQPQAGAGLSKQPSESDATLGLQGARSRSNFASLPDKGDLLGYPAQPVMRREAASTWYQADVSEDHALRAMIRGEMTITAPDGQPVRLKYERHLEHPNGNWTWVGRNADGEEALVTFGEKAVFGSIPHGHNELRLTTVAGRSWVVEIDPSKQRHPEPKQPDYLVPPELAAAVASSAPSTASAQTTPAAAGATASTTVDVALGYTVGFANELGGPSQAVTRLQFLVDITNQAYVSSQIDAQIRLVSTTQVNYSDATSNDDMLTKVTGYQAGTGSVPADPAFSQLRAARDQYGADLVAVVRRFRTPENDGCGLAWLIGGNQSGIDSRDAPFGYAVVSDDLDKGDVNETDGKKYICRLESLAHELGHNMGQNHNVEDSGGDSGAHPYSYGYREASTTGFYTIMAYRLPNSSQRNVRYFANPTVMEAQSGRPTGVANASDNARSMVQTMPLVATFRASVVPTQPATRAADDIDGDGKSDIVWTHPTYGNVYYWLMDGATQRSGQGYTVAPAGFKVQATGDYNGDGRGDLLLTNGTEVRMALGQSSGFTTAVVGAQPASGWLPAPSVDIDGDGKSDIVWTHPTYGNVYYWLMDGATQRSGQGYAVAPAGFKVQATGDYNGDGRGDLLLTNGTEVR